jgi:LacI family transcriptional regulator
MTTKPRATCRQVTILDIAREAQVSKSTVSLVLQGSDLIRAQTADRVREAALKLGYVYNRQAAELRRGTSNRIGVVINDLMNPFFAEVLVGLERKLVDAGYIVFMAHTNESLPRQQAVLTAMREQGAAGIAVCPVLGSDDSLVNTVTSWGIPLVIMIRSLGTDTCDFAGADNACGVQLATEHLVAGGHKRIGFVGGETGIVMDERLSGYKRALDAAGIAFDERLIFRTRPTREGGHAATTALLQSTPSIKAAVCYNDLVAFGALSALGEHGLKAGHDFSLMGFDNVLAAAHSNPPLSTVDVRPSELGEQAAALLLARIEAPDRPVQRYRGHPQLVLRQST